MIIVLALPFVAAGLAIKADSKQCKAAYENVSDAVRKYAYIEPDPVPVHIRRRLWKIWSLSLAALALYGLVVAGGSEGYWVCAAWASLGSFGFMASSIG